MKFYTNVQCVGRYIYYRGIDNGRRVKMKIDYSPTLYLPSNKPSKFKTLHGENLEPIQFDSVHEARDFMKKYDDVENFKVFGNTRYEYVFISEEHPEEVINWNIDQIVTCNIDIEVGSENGFPEPYLANEPLTAITLKYSNNKKYIVFGCGDYVKHRNDVEYIKCKDELDLIRKFMMTWIENYPDIVTGWNVKLFDIVYLYNRIKNMLGENEVKKLSPWNYISSRETTIMGKTNTIYDLVGIVVLDYMELFRKFDDESVQETYRLDHIAHVKLGKNKLSYDEFENLHQLYKNDFQKFIEYNIKDVELVEDLNNKGRLIEQALTIAYDNKTNYDDVFSQVRMWDTICYNALRSKDIIVPPNRAGIKDEAYAGAYVKDPKVGMFNWVASFDLNSLYPHLIMQYSISPENLVEKQYISERKNKIINELKNRKAK